MTAVRILLLLGWQDSGPGHWQSRWQALHGFERLQQDDWWWPKRADWMTRLQDSLLADERPAMPFPSTLVLSADDPFSDAACGLRTGADWGREIVSLGAAGHVNGDSGLGDWPEGLALLQALMLRAGIADAPPPA